MITDSRYAVGYRDTCKTTANRERRTSDTRYTVGYRDTCKTTAIRERRIVYNFCLAVDCTIFNRRIVCFYQYYIRVTGVSEIICVIMFVILQTTATRERIITDSRYAVGYRDSCKSTAILERIIVYNFCLAVD